jgi:hypothetical protein
MFFVHESKVIPDDLSWDKSCECLQHYLADNPQVYYYAAPAESFDLAQAAVVATLRGCTTVLYDNLS